MASGKSLELASITTPASSPKCACGGSWIDHLRKDGEVLARYNNEKHGPQVASAPMNRSQRRRAFRGHR